MSDSKQIKKSRQLILEVENQTIRKKATIWKRAFDAADMLDGLRFTGEWEGQELEVNFQHFSHGYLNVSVSVGGGARMMVMCQASNEHGMTIATALNDNEMLNIRVGR